VSVCSGENTPLVLYTVVHDKVLELKLLVIQRLGLNPTTVSLQCWRLRYGSTWMEDHIPLIRYHITNGTILHLEARLLGWGGGGAVRGTGMKAAGKGAKAPKPVDDAM
jgi:hypothetical protein